ncbi:hypothetical protein YOLOSWAG_276 [Erwinia phage vB_EamM_Yoloswag]|uniref:Uncharacterized protein n=1 Tax=Erwinia phage vB_EamM_Yoloswag TaxID=1958956 RepID=A0A1S6L3J3_9CAUD|nr:hypothetical protein HOR66_gp276 [Erwinia phage vB_EamM_Yoloswag]AQT28748.1 hypothetical protein YOLOSWAG_276 [Erwinia phage vB_EamM_Yoloswag]
MIVPNIEDHTGIDNAVILVDSEIDEGKRAIESCLLAFGLKASDIFYSPVYFDEHGESQGGWGAELTDSSKGRLKICDDKSIRDVCMISGDDLPSILDTIRDTGNRMRRRALGTVKTLSKRRVYLELTSDEYASLQAKAGGQSISDYIKRKLL